MSELDELARELFIADNAKQSREQSIVDWQWFMETPRFAVRIEHYQAMAEGAIAAGYRKPRQITTVEELKTVYAGCLIRESGGDLWSVDGATGRLFMIVDGADVTYDDDILTLPATVLYEPQPDCCTADGPTCATCASYAAEDAEPQP